MVECEFARGLLSEGATDVLIDTWWNVNRIEFVQKLVCNAVLIDTWWNVNLF